jgi:hypothetical protein
MTRNHPPRQRLRENMKASSHEKANCFTPPKPARARANRADDDQNHGQIAPLGQIQPDTDEDGGLNS